MCGIAGIVVKEPRALQPWASRVGSLLSHRGPDGQGFLWEEAARGLVSERKMPEETVSRLGLIHRRLAILDLTDAGQQPMLNGDGNQAVCFNGEIYNYRELARDRLAPRGVTVTSGSDTEVLLKQLETHGLGGLGELRGMFAFAWLDRARGKLYLVRDYFGIKPLYYSTWAGGLAFASELRALLCLSDVDRSLDPQITYQFLRFAIADDGRKTFFSHIHQVPPGHYLEIDLERPDEVRSVRYWQPGFEENLTVGFDEAAQEVRRRFVESVRVHLRSDVPVGAALSGGIDSSAVVACMRHLEPEMPIRAFCYAPKDSRFNEEAYARLVADRCGADLHLVDFTSADVARNIDALLDAQEEPVGSASIFAQACVYERARSEGVVVMLDGQGADEMFAGYTRYFGVRLADLVRRRQFGTIMKLWRRRREVGGGQTRAWLWAFEHLLPDTLKGLGRRCVGKELWYSYYQKDWFMDRGVEAARMEDVEHGRTLKTYLWETLHRTILPQLLHFEDRNSMRVSLESRVPFLHADLVEYAFSLPDDFMIGDDGSMKRVFRAAMKGLVPDEILERKDKIGFQPPEHALLQGAGGWIETVLQEADPEHVAMIDLPSLEAAWAAVRHQTDRVDSAIWRALVFVRWMTLQQRAAA